MMKQTSKISFKNVLLTRFRSSSFQALRINEVLVNRLTKLGIDRPTAIQENVIKTWMKFEMISSFSHFHCQVIWIEVWRGYACFTYTCVIFYQAIPAVVQRTNAIINAETGSGKTLCKFCKYFIILSCQHHIWSCSLMNKNISAYISKQKSFNLLTGVCFVYFSSYFWRI